MAFDPERYQAEKYPNSQLNFLDRQIYQREFTAISERILETIQNTQEEYRTKWNKNYPIIGAIVYGSWGRGKPHTQSDLDIALIASEDPGILKEEFGSRLRKCGVAQEIGFFWQIVVSEETTVEKLKEQNVLFFRLIGKQYNVITPYQNIAELFEITGKVGTIG